jgi:hypothetical protein
MPLDPWQATRLRPAAVAVHDDRKVARRDNGAVWRGVVVVMHILGGRFHSNSIAGFPAF